MLTCLAFARMSSGVAIPTSCTSRASPHVRWSQRRMEMMNLVAAMPLFAMSTRLITRLPPYSATRRS